jgi:hypothetical protein
MFPLAILAGWFPLKLSAIILFVVIYTIVYFIIWGIETRRNQQDIDEINTMLSKRKGFIPLVDVKANQKYSDRFIR